MVSRIFLYRTPQVCRNIFQKYARSLRNTRQCMAWVGLAVPSSWFKKFFGCCYFVPVSAIASTRLTASMNNLNRKWSFVYLKCIHTCLCWYTEFSELILMQMIIRFISQSWIYVWNKKPIRLFFPKIRIYK